MRAKHDFKVFVSAKEKELRNERLTAINVIDQMGFISISSENRPASDKSIVSQYSDEVRECDVYLGIFYKEYSEPSKTEFEIARGKGISPLTFQKKPHHYDDIQAIDPKLQEFLKKIKDRQSGVVVKEFDNIVEFREEVREGLTALLVRKFKDFRKLSVQSQNSNILKQEIERAAISNQSAPLKAKIEKIEELMHKYGLAIAQDLDRASIIESRIPKFFSRGGADEVYAKVKGTANNAFLDLLVVDQDNNQYWNPDPRSYDSALDKGTAIINGEYSSRWIFNIPSNARKGKYNALILLYEDLFEPTKMRQAIAYEEKEFDVT